MPKHNQTISHSHISANLKGFGGYWQTAWSLWMMFISGNTRSPCVMLEGNENLYCPLIWRTLKDLSRNQSSFIISWSHVKLLLWCILVLGSILAWWDQSRMQTLVPIIAHCHCPARPIAVLCLNEIWEYNTQMQALWVCIVWFAAAMWCVWVCMFRSKFIYPMLIGRPAAVCLLPMED